MHSTFAFSSYSDFSPDILRVSKIQTAALVNPKKFNYWLQKMLKMKL